jgi:hypothetical protein
MKELCLHTRGYEQRVLIKSHSSVFKWGFYFAFLDGIIYTAEYRRTVAVVKE